MKHHHGCWTVRRRRAACRSTAATINHHRPSNPRHLLLYRLYHSLSILHFVNNSLSNQRRNPHTHTAIMVRHAAGRLIHQTAIHTANTLPSTVPPHRPSQRPRPANRSRSLGPLSPRRPRHTPLQPIPQHTSQRLTRLLSRRLLTPSRSPPHQLAHHPRRPQDDHAASRIRYR
jgi:hypothetical protein